MRMGEKRSYCCSDDGCKHLIRELIPEDEFDCVLLEAAAKACRPSLQVIDDDDDGHVEKISISIDRDRDKVKFRIDIVGKNLPDEGHGPEWGPEWEEFFPCGCHVEIHGSISVYRSCCDKLVSIFVPRDTRWSHAQEWWSEPSSLNRGHILLSLPFARHNLES